MFSFFSHLDAAAMFSSRRDPTSIRPASEADGPDSIDGPIWIISELVSQYRIACGNEPTGVVRLARKLPDGEFDRIEVSVRKRDPRLAQTLLKALIPFVATLGTKSIAALELDDGERVALSELLRAYQDGSHPSCRVGK